MKKILTTLTGILALGATALAQTTVPALITSDQVWTTSGSPYLINQNTYIDEGVSVRIMPGVQVIAANSSITLDVDGELQGRGSSSSPVLIDKLQIKLSAKGKPYNSTTDSGALFNYCEFSSPGIGKQVVATSISTRISNCTFLHTYYSIYVTSSSLVNPLIEVLDCQFTDSTGMMYPFYSSGYYSDIIFSGNTCQNLGKGGGMYVYGREVEMTGNTIYGVNRIHINAHNSTISCNLFTHMRSGIEITVSGQDTTNKTIFEYNTLDSLGGPIMNDPMLKVYNLYMPHLNYSHFNHNNFLTALGTSFKVQISGYNADPTTFKTVDFQNNYWASTSAGTIDGYIFDYNDDIKQFAKADYSNFLSSIDTSCGDTSSCNASFYMAVDTANPYNLYLINNSTGITSNTEFTWNFGDGNTSDDENPSHVYEEFGVYYLCLTLYNEMENCSSTYCDSIGLDSLGNMLKNGAFTLYVLNESDINGMHPAQPFEELSIYPNPSAGMLMIDLVDEGNGPLQIRVLDMAGRLVFEDVNEQGSGKHSLNLSMLPEGLYLLNLQKGQEIYTTKIVIGR